MLLHIFQKHALFNFCYNNSQKEAEDIFRKYLIRILNNAKESFFSLVNGWEESDDGWMYNVFYNQSALDFLSYCLDFPYFKKRIHTDDRMANQASTIKNFFMLYQYISDECVKSAVFLFSHVSILKTLLETHGYYFHGILFLNYQEQILIDSIINPLFALFPDIGKSDLSDRNLFEKIKDAKDEPMIVDCTINSNISKKNLEKLLNMLSTIKAGIILESKTDLLAPVNSFSFDISATTFNLQKTLLPFTDCSIVGNYYRNFLEFISNNFADIHTYFKRISESEILYSFSDPVSQMNYNCFKCIISIVNYFYSQLNIPLPDFLTEERLQAVFDFYYDGVGEDTSEVPHLVAKKLFSLINSKKIHLVNLESIESIVFIDVPTIYYRKDFLFLSEETFSSLVLEVLPLCLSLRMVLRTLCYYDLLESYSNGANQTFVTRITIPQSDSPNQRLRLLKFKRSALEKFL